MGSQPAFRGVLENPRWRYALQSATPNFSACRDHRSSGGHSLHGARRRNSINSRYKVLAPIWARKSHHLPGSRNHLARHGEILLLVTRTRWSAGSRKFWSSRTHFRVRLRLGERDGRQWLLRPPPRPRASHCRSEHRRLRTRWAESSPASGENGLRARFELR